MCAPAGAPRQIKICKHRQINLSTRKNGADSSESAPFCFHYEVKEAYSLHFLKAHQHSAKLGVEAAETAKGMDLYLGVFEFGVDHVF